MDVKMSRAAFASITYLEMPLDEDIIIIRPEDGPTLAMRINVLVTCVT